MSLSALRASPSAWGNQPTQDAIAAIKVGYQKQQNPDITKRVDYCLESFRRRRIQAAKINAVLRGDFDSLTTNLLASRYHESIFAKLKMDVGVSTRVNVLRDVLDKVDVTLSEGLNYRMQGEANLKRLMHFMDVVDFTGVLQRVSRMCWLHKAVCVMPQVAWSDRVKRQVVEMCVLTPDRFDLVCLSEESGLWDALVVYDDDVDERTVITSDLILEQELGRDGATWTTVEERPNRDGMIAAVIFKPVRDLPWWDEAYGPQLAEATLQANASETFIDWMMNGQVKALTGADMGAAGKGQLLAHGYGLETGKSGASVVDLQTDLGALIANFVTRERVNAAQALGLNGSEWDMASLPPSGEAMKMKFWARDRVALARRGWMLRDAAELYWLTLHRVKTALVTPVMADVEMENEDGTVTRGMQPMPLPIAGFEGDWVPGEEYSPPDPASVLPPMQDGVPWQAQKYQPEFEARDVGYPVTAQEQIADEEYQISKGYKKRVDFWRERYPDAVPDDDAKATARMEENLREEARLRKVTDPPAPDASLPLAEQRNLANVVLGEQSVQVGPPSEKPVAP